MSTLLHTYILLIGCLCPIMLFAQKHYTKQSVYPIANFAWKENDTTRYEGHYRFEYAYKLIVKSNNFNQNPTLWQKIKSYFE